MKILPIYWAILTYMLLKPTGDTAHHFLFFKGIDKVVHFLVFAILGFLFSIVFRKSNFLFFVIMFLYALLTEILQGVMSLGRSFEIWDLVADMLGVSVGYWLYHKFWKYSIEK